MHVAQISVALKEGQGLGGIAKEDLLAISQQQQLVKELGNVGAGLVDGKHDGAVAVACEFLQRFHQREGCLRVESGRELVQEEKTWVGDEL